MIGMTFVLFLATLMRSRPDLCENSTAYTRPSYNVTKNTTTKAINSKYFGKKSYTKSVKTALCFNSKSV